MSVNRLALGDRLQTIERSIACTCRPGTLLAYCASQLLRFIISIHPYVYTSCHYLSLQFCFLLRLLQFLSCFVLAHVTVYIHVCSCHYVDIFLPFVIRGVQSLVFGCYRFLGCKSLLISKFLWTLCTSNLPSFTASHEN
jgi:hypothetical protein